jgi:hypothetical protein
LLWGGGGEAVGTALVLVALRQAARQNGCPVCAVQREAEEQYLRFWVHEGTNDGAAISKLLQSRGFCSRHTEQAKAFHEEQWRDGMGIANTYQYLLTQWVKDLDKLRGALDKGRPISPRRRRQLVEEMLGARAQCPPCESGEHTAEFAVHCLLAEIEDAMTGNRWRALYESSDGLCLAHLRFALSDAHHPNATAFLLRVEREKIASLLAEVQEYLRKCDYRFKDEPKGSEQDSWVRALAKFVGTQEVKKPCRPPSKETPSSS